MIQYLLIFVVMIFMKIEKEQDRIKAELKERNIQAALAAGTVWQDPEELERLEAKENERLAEEARIQDLKDKCARKGLNFEDENRKYLERMERKAQKKKMQSN